MYLHLNTHICIYIYIHIYLFTFIYIYICIHLLVHIYLNIYIYIHIYMYIYTYIEIYIYVCVLCELCMIDHAFRCGWPSLALGRGTYLQKKCYMAHCLQFGYLKWPLTYRNRFVDS